MTEYPLQKDSDDLSPFFIVGVGRSGTTLLMAMLNAHPDVTLPPETHFIRRYATESPPRSSEDAKAKLGDDSYLPRLGLDLDQVVDRIVAENASLSWANVYHRLLRTYRDQAGKAVIGDKDPKSVEYLPTVRHLYPQAKILHVIRDPRDVYVSRQNADWSKDRSSFSHLLAYRAQFRLGRQSGQTLFGAHYTEVQYERLIQDPEPALREVCELLEIDYRDEMLNFSEGAKSIVAPDEAAWKRNVTGPILAQNAEKWRHELTIDEVSRIEAACEFVFDEGLYERSGWERSWCQRARCVTLAALVKAAEPVYVQMVKRANQRAIRDLTTSA